MRLQYRKRIRECEYIFVYTLIQINISFSENHKYIWRACTNLLTMDNFRSGMEIRQVKDTGWFYFINIHFYIAWNVVIKKIIEIKIQNKKENTLKKCTRCYCFGNILKVNFMGKRSKFNKFIWKQVFMCDYLAVSVSMVEMYQWICVRVPVCAFVCLCFYVLNSFTSNIDLLIYAAFSSVLYFVSGV